MSMIMMVVVSVVVVVVVKPSSRQSPNKQSADPNSEEIRPVLSAELGRKRRR
jgi:hypothetical protein